MRPDYISDDGRVRLYQGDALDVLRSLDATEQIAATITDPPYSSGGFNLATKTQSTATKYAQNGRSSHASFSGDGRDALAFLAWCDLWMRECRRLSQPGAYMLSFSDWRQLPAVAQAIQVAGFYWRGVVTWNKTLASRAPHKGYFRHQVEFVPWGTNGPCHKATHDGPFPGCVSVRLDPRKKLHQVAKPVELMRELVRCVPPGGVVLDPFAGSATTGVAAIEAGLGFIGIESDPHYFAISRDRLAEAIANRDADPIAGRVGDFGDQAA